MLPWIVQEQLKNYGAKQVNIIYRRAEKQMPAEKKEIEDAKKEGINFLFQNNIVKIIGQDNVQKLELIKTELVKKEGETREVPVNIENSNYFIDTDYVVMALGSTVSDEVFDLGLTLDKWGNIYIDENYQTSNSKIFAGGDLAGCKGTVAWAARSGRDVAEKIIEKLKNAGVNTKIIDNDNEDIINIFLNHFHRNDLRQTAE